MAATASVGEPPKNVASKCCSAERRAVEHGRPVVEQLDPAVEGPALPELERDVRVGVVHPLAAGGAGDHREHHDPEAVDHARERSAAGETAESGAIYGGVAGGLTSEVEDFIVMFMDAMLDTQQSLPPAPEQV